MKVGTILMLLLSYVFCCILPHAAAQEEIIAYNGASYPDFSVVKNGRIFCTADENYGDVFLSRKVLYSIDLNNMSAEKVFSVRNAYSEIFVDSDTIYFTYPKSWFSSHLVYGDHTWYSSSISDAEKKKNWNKMCENNSKTDRWMRYFQTIDGVYGYVRPDGEYGSCELGKYEDEKYTQVLSADNARFIYGHSFVIIDRPDRLERQELEVYDIKGKRILTVPYTEETRPEIIICANKLYYTMSRQVLCYDINTGEAEVVYTSENDGFLYLCYDGISLFIIEKSDDENNRFYEMSVSDNQFVKSFVLPSEFCNYGEYIITEGFILNGRESESELVVYDIDTESGCYISRGK